MFGDQFKTTPPMIWWKSITLKNPEQYFDWPRLQIGFFNLCHQLLTAVAATAGLERIFSTFGLVQSKLRNRLGNEKASKLTFIFKYLNQDCKKKATNMNWVWEEEAEEGVVEPVIIPHVETEMELRLITTLSDSDDEDMPLALLQNKL